MGMNLFLYDVIVDFYVFFVYAAFYLIYTIEISGDGIFYKFGKNFQISVMSKQNKKNLKKNDRLFEQETSYVIISIVLRGMSTTYYLK